MSQLDVRPITVNQIGYPTHSGKTAIFAELCGPFEVIDTSTGYSVFKGETSGAIEDAASGLTVYRGDFSEVTATGRYRIRLESGEVSGDFDISEQPYDPLLRGLLKGFYYYRCGTELTEEFAGVWAHKACHLGEGIVHGDPERRLDSCGGWHDAGDYGKYSGPGAKAIADLLLAYELNPTAFSRPVPLPETDGRMPDVLHECRWELDFLFKMQDSNTGGIFHKLTTLKFPPLDTMPEDDLGDLYFSPISATATGCFAAVMALASRIYLPFDASFADRCLSAAVQAWDWLAAYPEAPNFRNPSDVSTGEYGDKQDIDERYWAAAELYRTTGDTVYHEAFLAFANMDFHKYSLGWADMGGYGTIAYLLMEADKLDSSLKARLLEGLHTEVEQLVHISETDGYRISLRQDQYIWGSNMLVMNHAMLLLIAYRLFGNSAYKACALDHIHYLVGRNALDISYVTGFGDRPVKDTHYRPSVAAGVDSAPGLVSGGPNAGLQDPYAKEQLQGKPPAQCFVDHIDSYATNEVTIYWNSPALFAVAMFV